jgi:hypothetical protein
MSIGHHPSVRVYHNNSVKVEKMCIRRAAISAIPPAPDDTSFEEDTRSVTHTPTRLSSDASASLILPTRAVALREYEEVSVAARAEK